MTCTVCSYFYLCKDCAQMGCHPEHPLTSRAVSHFEDCKFTHFQTFANRSWRLQREGEVIIKEDTVGVGEDPLKNVSARKDLTDEHVAPDTPATSSAPVSPPAEAQTNKSKKASWWRRWLFCEKKSKVFPKNEDKAEDTVVPPSEPQQSTISTEKCEVKDVGVQTEVSCPPNSLLFFCTKKVTLDDEPRCPEVNERDEPLSRPCTPAGHGGSQGAMLRDHVTHC
ncbi:uncharacterized protein LOC120436276 [Oreochromis aureus]|uniref:uncharacterized protein LOC120436276 n=1 Tax=Oreochromis aureus TaxID=47969 RepID=UPI001953FADE|nr:uncharacterized protein LOC120436276 [Oreochromis aureus]